MALPNLVVIRLAGFQALVRIIQLYMEQDYCTCDPLPGSSDEEECHPLCDRCMVCMGRKALRGVDMDVDPHHARGGSHG